jgi:hypothetical protein
MKKKIQWIKTSSNKGETMEKVKNEAKRIWGLAAAHPKISVAVVVVIVAIYFLIN